MKSFSGREGTPPVITFDLLAFKDIEKYGKYREALGGDVETRHGLVPLLSGEVTGCSSTKAGAEGVGYDGVHILSFHPAFWGDVSK